MNREPQPCGMCAKFLPAAGQKPTADGPGHCEGHDRLAQADDRPCVLFAEQGAWATRKAQQPPKFD